MSDKTNKEQHELVDVYDNEQSLLDEIRKESPELIDEDGNIFISWRYGLVKVSEEDDGEPIYDLCEIYIDVEGNPYAFCDAKPTSAEDLQMALNDVQNYKPTTKYYETGTFDYISSHDYELTGWKWTENPAAPESEDIESDSE